MLKFYGSVDLFFLSLCKNVNKNFFNNNDIVVFFIFIISILIKFGLTPNHLLKLEVYNGLPYVTILLYTTIFFFMYFYYFAILVFFNLNYFFKKISFIFFTLLIISSIITVFYIFNLNLIKSFFAYSTLINLINFFTLLISFL